MVYLFFFSSKMGVQHYMPFYSEANIFFFILFFFFFDGYYEPLGRHKDTVAVHAVVLKLFSIATNLSFLVLSFAHMVKQSYANFLFPLQTVLLCTVSKESLQTEYT